MSDAVFHYTDKLGWNAIRSQPTWLFKASTPPGEHDTGAYFTPLPPDTPKLAVRLGLPKRKVEYVFEFLGIDGLAPAPNVGRRERFIVFAPADYPVEPNRQRYNGATVHWRPQT